MNEAARTAVVHAKPPAVRRGHDTSRQSTKATHPLTWVEIRRFLAVRPRAESHYTRTHTPTQLDKILRYQDRYRFCYTSATAPLGPGLPVRWSPGQSQLYRGVQLRLAADVLLHLPICPASVREPTGSTKTSWVVVSSCKIRKPMTPTTTMFSACRLIHEAAGSVTLLNEPRRWSR